MITRIKKLNLIGWLLIIILCLLAVGPVQSQTPEIGITLTWSTDTYAPPGYSGKALPARGSVIETVANIDSRTINPEELDYQWFLNHRLQKAASGPGKQVFKFNIGNVINREHSVKAEIRNIQGELLASSAYLSIEVRQPEIIFEAETTRLESIDLTQRYLVSAEQEVNFRAIPYFFNIDQIEELNFDWQIDEKKATQLDQENGSLFSLKVGQIAESIEKKISLWVKNKNNPLQQSQAKAIVVFAP